MDLTMLWDLTRIFLGSAVGTWGFGLLLHAPRRSRIAAAALGGLGYALYYLLMQLGVSEPSSIFAAACLSSFLAHTCARRMRMIATIFVTLSIVSLVPGLGLYRCMALVGEGKNALGLQTGAAAMISFIMIALGLAVGSFLFRAIVAHIRIQPHHHRRKEGV